MSPLSLHSTVSLHAKASPQMESGERPVRNHFAELMPLCTLICGYGYAFEL